jgi:predicted HicB family RNase H-like nuclease
MKTYFEYKGYLGSAEVDTEGNALVGKLLFIRDVIAYSATSLKDLEKAFHEAADDYLKTCTALGDEPDTPCKGTFNVRIGPDLHREVALVARAKGVGLNDFVCQALAAAVQSPPRKLVEHLHKHQHNVVVQAAKPAERFAGSTQPTLWEEYAIRH